MCAGQVSLKRQGNNNKKVSHTATATTEILEVVLFKTGDRGNRDARFKERWELSRMSLNRKCVLFVRIDSFSKKNTVSKIVSKRKEERKKSNFPSFYLLRVVNREFRKWSNTTSQPLSNSSSKSIHITTTNHAQPITASAIPAA